MTFPVDPIPAFFGLILDALAIWANVGSLVGLAFSIGGGIFSVWKYLQLRETRRRYRLLLLSPQITARLERCLDVLEDPYLTSSEAQPTLGQIRSSYRTLEKVVDTPHRADLERDRGDIKRLEKNFSLRLRLKVVSQVHAHLTRLKDRIEEIKIDQI